jgi:hypothetical protein
MRMGMKPLRRLMARESLPETFGRWLRERSAL